MKLLKVIFFLIVVSLQVEAEEILIPAPPVIEASSYVVMDFDSGKILLEKSMGKKLAPASLTKIMTVYVVAHELANGRISLKDEVIVSEKAWRTEGSRMFIEVGKKIKLDDLLHGVIIQSGNDASVALAEHVSGTEDVFADLMNKHAEKLGMGNSNFVNSTGLPNSENYTTANDMVRLAQALIRDYPEVYSLHKIKEYTFNGIKQNNRNTLLWRDNSVDGIKTGHTKEAGYCLVASAVRDGMRLISVVMGADGKSSRAKNSQAILGYGFRFFETHKLYSVGDLIASAKIWKAAIDNINLSINEDLYITIPRGEYEKLESIVKVEKLIMAPVSQGNQKGVLNIMLKGNNIKSVPLSTLNSVAEGDIFDRLKDEIYLLFE
ncbi:MAG: serine-type D-Ala-D-Ala carboxypeptidase [Legionellales bacterium]|nr:serine-type D-Ala-D-Ala carboxypeptidase [Legionellales bacterium]|tara:strand:+ start:564 stop:1697 length:1134 start_codon:yes stop_codon:yes gene_type:complete